MAISKDETAKVAVLPPAIKQWVWRIAVWTAVILSISMLSTNLRRSTLSIPANGNSAAVKPEKVGDSVAFTGDGFMTHCVYSDGRDLEYPCVSGPIVYYYAHDTSGKPNTVSYKIVHANN